MSDAINDSVADLLEGEGISLPDDLIEAIVECIVLGLEHSSGVSHMGDPRPSKPSVSEVLNAVHHYAIMYHEQVRSRSWVEEDRARTSWHNLKRLVERL